MIVALIDSPQMKTEKLEAEIIITDIPKPIKTPGDGKSNPFHDVPPFGKFNDDPMMNIQQNYLNNLSQHSHKSE